MSLNYLKQLPSLNGWRAVAILLVLGRHTVFTNGFPAPYANLFTRLFDGELGVRFFFTISGFLITWLMVKEENVSGGVSLKRFYLRRALRILPVYLTCLLVLAVMQFTGFAIQSGYVWFQLLTFTRNFYQTSQAEFPLSAHLWSLSVEEQFYLVWPVIFLWLCGSQRKRIGFLLGLIAFSIGWKIIALLGCYDRHLYFLFEDHSTFMALDCLAYGCGGAILLATREGSLKIFFEKYFWPVFLLAGLLLLAPEMAGLGRGMQSFAFIFLLLQSVLFPRFAPFRILNHRWLVHIGILSYSLYVWQQLVFLLWPFPRLWFLALPVIFVAAMMSYQFLEEPFFSWRSQLRAPEG